MDTASRKVLRLLRNSLMRKKNLLSLASAAPPPKLIKMVKHYFVAAPRRCWVEILSGLVNTLMFPRAIVFSDDGRAEVQGEFLREMRLRSLTVSANFSEMALRNPR